MGRNLPCCVRSLWPTVSLWKDFSNKVYCNVEEILLSLPHQPEGAPVQEWWQVGASCSLKLWSAGEHEDGLSGGGIDEPHRAQRGWGLALSPSPLS